MTGLGLCGPGGLLHHLPGWKETSWAYHSDGYKYRGSLGVPGVRYGGQYGSGDTVGCGINMRTGKIFFTKNGFTLGKDCPILPHMSEIVFLLFFFGIKVSLTSRPKKKGVAFGNVKGILFPSFGIGERGGISVNFGKSNFVYDIKAHNWAVEDPATVPL